MGREHCQIDKESPIEDKDEATDCADLPRGCEKCWLNPADLDSASLLNLLEMAFEIAYTPICDEIKSLLDEKSSISIKKSALAKIAQTAKTCKLGTCLEMSALGFTYADKSLSAQVEIFHIENGNHVFLVLGRAPGSSPAHYRQWGEAAVVCDVWRGESYLASELENKLQNFERQTPDLKTILKPFDPQKQSLKQLV